MSTHLISLKHFETDNEQLYKVKETATAAAHIFSTFPHLDWLHSSDSKVSCLTVWPRCQATSLTRESVSVPQQSHEPGRASEFSWLWRETLRTDQRGLCAKKWTCQCAVRVWCCFIVKLKPFAYIFLEGWLALFWHELGIAWKLKQLQFCFICWFTGAKTFLPLK